MASRRPWSRTAAWRVALVTHDGRPSGALALDGAHTLDPSWTADGTQLLVASTQRNPAGTPPDGLDVLLMSVTGTTALELVRVQPQGKKEMAGADWGRGLRGGGAGAGAHCRRRGARPRRGEPPGPALRRGAGARGDLPGGGAAGYVIPLYFPRARCRSAWASAGSPAKPGSGRRVVCIGPWSSARRAIRR